MRDSARFVAFTFALTWIVMIPPMLAFRGLAALPPALVALCAVIGSSAPSLVALAIVRARGEGVRSLRAAPGATSWPRRLVWTVVALAMPVGLHLVGAAVAFALGAGSDVFTFGTPITPEHWGILVIAPIGEELGWRGYMQRRLETTTGALQASLLVGVAWAAWHAPMWIAAAPHVHVLLAGVWLIMAGTIVFAALFRASGGSVLVAIAAHLGVHGDNVTRVGGVALYATCGAFTVAAMACGAWLLRTDRVAPRS